MTDGSDTTSPRRDMTDRDHNLFDEPNAKRAAQDILDDFHANWGPFCRALDVPVSAIRDVDSTVMVAVLLIRLHRDLERRIAKLEARLNQ